jgi:hypothetical protein
MNTTWIFTLAPLALVPLFVPQQPTAPRKLARVSGEAGPQAKGAKEPALGDWQQRLSESDLERRESAYAELVEKARGDKALREQLEQWASAGSAPDLAWTARLALRELRGAGPAHARAGQARMGGDFDDLRRRFDDLERHFGGMDSMFEDLRSRLDSGLQPYFAVPGNPQPFQTTPPGQPGGSQQFQSYSLQVGPDGVELETTENVDGNSQKKTYKAKSMDELLQQHPELRGQIGGGAGGGFRLELPGAAGQNHWSIPGWDQPQGDWFSSPRSSQQPPTDVLGIYSQKLTPEQAKELELEPEQGLRIERIEPGTIAQILGIRRGDTLVELNGKAVYSADDVRKALKERKADEDLSVTLIGEGSHERRTLRWSPAVPQPGAEKPRKL